MKKPLKYRQISPIPEKHTASIACGGSDFNDSESAEMNSPTKLPALDISKLDERLR